ncbi:DUF302 domain-containing protein [Sphingomonas sp. S2-65]|uniref:DUF302 domain-containing protein n=1 Tax=Sphingomonas sp. S2-65 TaxID=2903960 RepID=UPI001F46B30D|nr:DUF302 domain-containing protein [Sphingomonas sp. S2-65]UYY58028.1 DUF302 domain-containing protein [Sphingomonas sp. S2-65]
MTAAGLVERQARGGFTEVLDRVEAALVGHGLVPLARIDHAAAAAEAGLALAPLTLLIFGNPRTGTPLMQARPSLGIDLPLKLLVWEAEGAVRIGYNNPAWLVERHGGDADGTIPATMRNLLEALANEAAA